MNACLKKPCPWGFAYLVAGKYKHLLDYYGAFSYSTTGRISGMEYNATAFVGCDNQVCCACYGPKGGKKDYCTENCKAVNGGTVTKDIFSWFWIRSSLPKRLWKKCMEYELKRRDGKVIWYKLVGESIVPVEGRCSKDTALLHDGIVVVPNYTAAQKVPAIDGLLEYRKDKQELYVRSNKTWNAVAQKNKISKEMREKNMVNLGRIRKLEKGLDSQKQLMNLTFIQLDKEIRNLKKYVSANLPHKECNSYKVIENKDRNIKYSGGGSYFCDSNISPGWYRFRGDAGTQMSTTCVKGSSSSHLKCSTHAVSWLNGAHPSVSEGKVTRKVCFSYDGNCCYWNGQKTIEVINCGFFYVYKLSRPPHCSARYCGTDI